MLPWSWQKVVYANVVGDIYIPSQYWQDLERAQAFVRKETRDFQRMTRWLLYGGLKFYQKERETYPDALEETLTPHQAELVAGKIARHFGLTPPKILHNCRTRGHAYESLIELPPKATILLVAHELAHCWTKQRLGYMRHDKKMARTVRNFISYCRRKNFWKEELQKGETAAYETYLKDAVKETMQPAPAPRLYQKPTETEIAVRKILETDDRLRKLRAHKKLLETCIHKQQRRLSALLKKSEGEAS